MVVCNLNKYSHNLLPLYTVWLLQKNNKAIMKLFLLFALLTIKLLLYFTRPCAIHCFGSG